MPVAVNKCQYGDRLSVSTEHSSDQGLNNICIWNKRPDDDPVRVETCSLLLSINIVDVFDILFI